MAQFTAKVGPETSTLTVSDAVAAPIVRTYNRIHGASADMTNAQALDWFWRFLLRDAKRQVDELEISEAARDAAIVARDGRSSDVFA